MRSASATASVSTTTRLKTLISPPRHGCCVTHLVSNVIRTNEMHVWFVAEHVEESMMPTQIRIIRGGDFIIATPEGQVDLEASKLLLEEIASTLATLVSHGIL